MSDYTKDIINQRIRDISMSVPPPTSKDDILREIQNTNELLKIMINKIDELIQLNKSG